MPLSLFIIENEAVMRDSLCTQLRHQGFPIRGTAMDGFSALSAIARLRPDIVICDLTLPDLNGLTLIRVLCAISPSIRVIALSLHSDDLSVRAAASAGAQACVAKNAIHDELVPAIARIAATHLPAASHAGSGQISRSACATAPRAPRLKLRCSQPGPTRR